MVTEVPESERMFRAGLRYGADVLEQNKRESDPGTFTAGVEACVEVLRKLSDGGVPQVDPQPVATGLWCPTCQFFEEEEDADSETRCAACGCAYSDHIEVSVMPA